MQYRLLGRTGLRVSRLCFGALTVGPCQADMPPETAGEIISRAFELGVNFIDTAQLYQSYAHIAAALRRPAARDIVIASKTYAYEADAALKAVEEARTALNRDVIDIFLLHEQESAHTLRGHAAALDMLYRLKAQNQLRAVGISTHHIAGVYAAAEAGLDVVHPLLNLAGYGILDGSRDEMDAACRHASDLGLGIYLMKPFGGGNLLSRSSECLAYSLQRDYAAAVAVGICAVHDAAALQGQRAALDFNSTVFVLPVDLAAVAAVFHRQISAAAHLNYILICRATAQGISVQVQRHGALHLKFPSGLNVSA